MVEAVNSMQRVIVRPLGMKQVLRGDMPLQTSECGRSSQENQLPVLSF